MSFWAIIESDIVIISGGTLVVVEINRDRFFTLEEARAILPIIFRITEGYSRRVGALIERLDQLSLENHVASLEIETEVNALIKQWQSKVQKLGALPKGLWVADFDAGDGYFCWKYPEREVEFWHSYNDGFSKRINVARVDVPIANQPTQNVPNNLEI